MKNGNFDKLKSAQYSQEVLDANAEEGVTLGLFGDNRKDVEDLLNSQGDINNFTERKKSVVEITSKQDND